MPRFLASEDEDADVTPQVICPRPKPRPIRKQQAPAQQTPISAKITSIQSPEDVTVAGLLPQGHKKGAGKEITPVGTEELLAQVFATTGAPSQTLALNNHPAASKNGRVQSGNAEAGPSTSVLDSEPGFELAEGENGTGSELPVRRSRRLATKQQ